MNFCPKACYYVICFKLSEDKINLIKSQRSDNRKKYAPKKKAEKEEEHKDDEDMIESDRRTNVYHKTDRLNKGRPAT